MTDDKKKSDKQQFIDSIKGGVEHDPRGTRQEKYQKRLNEIFDLRDPIRRLVLLRKVKKWIVEDRKNDMIRNGWANEWLEVVNSEITKANKEKIADKQEKKPQEKYDTREKRVDRVQEIKRQEQCKYDVAIEMFNEEMGEEIYNGYASFNSQRNKVHKKTE